MGDPTPLAGIAGYLRTIAGPRLQAVALRLHLSRHEAVFEDDLDAARPSLRLRLLPWRAPFSKGQTRGWETLELSPEGGPEEQVVVRRWCEATGGEVESEDRVPAGRLGAALEGRLLEFVASSLERT
jgi:hypothetical protein